MARVGEEVRFRLARAPCFFKGFILFDLRFDSLILRDRAHDDVGQIHHGKTRVVNIRELVSEILQRRIHIDAHDNEKDRAEIKSVRKVKEEEHDRNGNEKKEDARAFGSAGKKEEHERDPVNDALDVDGQMHEPSALLLSELADREIYDGDRGHDGAEQGVLCDKRVPADEIIHAQINTERNYNRINDYAQRQINGYITFIDVKSFQLAHMIHLNSFIIRLNRSCNLSLIFYYYKTKPSFRHLP